MHIRNSGFGSCVEGSSETGNQGGRDSCGDGEERKGVREAKSPSRLGRLLEYS